MSEQEKYSFKVGPWDLQPGKPDPSSKPSIDKLIDINHHLMRRVEELEEIVGMYMERGIRGNVERMKTQGVKHDE